VYDEPSGAPELDLGRLGAIAEQLGESPGAIAQTLHEELSRAMAELDRGLATGDDEAADRAVHAARNSALMISASPMLASLRAMAAVLAAGDRAAARDVRVALDGHWSRLAAALRAAGAQSAP
jgi:hypothetical protein